MKPPGPYLTNPEYLARHAPDEAALDLTPIEYLDALGPADSAAHLGAAALSAFQENLVRFNSTDASQAEAWHIEFVTACNPDYPYRQAETFQSKPIRATLYETGYLLGSPTGKEAQPENATPAYILMRNGNFLHPVIFDINYRRNCLVVFDYSHIPARLVPPPVLAHATTHLLALAAAH